MYQLAIRVSFSSARYMVLCEHVRFYAFCRVTKYLFVCGFYFCVWVYFVSLPHWLSVRNGSNI